MTTQVERMPVAGLCALAVAGFVTILTEALPAGLLRQIGVSLGVSEAMAGQWISIYALGSLLAAIPLTAATRSWRRRPLLLGAIIGFAIANLITGPDSEFYRRDDGTFRRRCIGRPAVGVAGRLYCSHGTARPRWPGHGHCDGGDAVGALHRHPGRHIYRQPRRLATDLRIAQRDRVAAGWLDHREGAGFRRRA
ncbi:membrane hypothetical protein [Agrobacterium tumefaciens str. Kerr 14]|uniref:Major facilitator superfamily (MFS) profile domain-containing protein n=1 Tax=Agrobacterium tumefaciens str. Kerr 14 TaxID=1183424 RepID=A0A1S7Q3C2_AGRTU|nr:membrane hypothetical protein [Agrobacterium tumefaciens str. Kerr 14]